jgi:hypothetical protein
MSGRGAKPGERRGGRAKGVPNKATVAKKVAQKRAEAAVAAKRSRSRKKSPDAPGATPAPPATLSRAAAEATAAVIAGHPCDPVEVMLELCQWAFDEFNRLRGLPGGKEVIELANGDRVTNTVKEYALRAATLAREVAPYKSPKLANVAVTKTEDRQITIRVERQGVVERQATFIDGVFTEIAEAVEQEIAA